MAEDLLTSTTRLAHRLWDSTLSHDSVAVDATCGRGRDTLYLCLKCRYVYGFDIQPQAIAATRDLLQRHQLANFHLVLASHSRMAEFVAYPVDLVAFNLGWLPGGAHTLTTTAGTTCEAVGQALRLIRPGGLVSVVMYPGHPEGARERDALLAYAGSLEPRRFHCFHGVLVNQPQLPPEILLITRKADQPQGPAAAGS